MLLFGSGLDGPQASSAYDELVSVPAFTAKGFTD